MIEISTFLLKYLLFNLGHCPACTGCEKSFPCSRGDNTCRLHQNITVVYYGYARDDESCIISKYDTFCILGNTFKQFLLRAFIKNNHQQLFQKKVPN